MRAFLTRRARMTNSEVLVGMKDISGFLRVGPKVVNRWMAQYKDFPVIRDGYGRLYSNAVALSAWHQNFVAGMGRRRNLNATKGGD